MAYLVCAYYLPTICADDLSLQDQHKESNKRSGYEGPVRYLAHISIDKLGLPALNCSRYMEDGTSIAVELAKVEHLRTESHD
jgi:hypothetical protein